MKRYRFALESALRARRAQEDVARQRLGQANRRVQAAWAAHRAALEACQVVAGPSGLTDREGFVAARMQEVRMADAAERTRRVALEAEVEASTFYTAWVEAGKQVASLERLDERRRADWTAEGLREEAAVVDDVVGSRWSLAATSGVDSK